MERQEILQELQSLKRKVRHLTKEIESIKALSLENSSAIERMLKARGLKVFRRNPTEGLFFSPGFLPSPKNRFYEMMKKYSFRLVLRDMIKNQDHFHIEHLTHYCTPKTARGYCEFLSDLEMIVREGDQSYRTRISPLYSFGPTLEWFIAEMFKREFVAPAIYGVSLKETPSGGDYDVMAAWNRRLVYVEVKSSPPKGVEWSEISTFFSRVEDLLPEIAILFNDTQLRMKDKLVVLFEEELKRRYGGKSRTLYPVERLVGELFHIGHRLFIINSKKDIADNFQICLKDYLRHHGGNDEVRRR